MRGRNVPAAHRLEVEDVDRLLRRLDGLVGAHVNGSGSLLPGMGPSPANAAPAASSGLPAKKLRNLRRLAACSANDGMASPPSITMARVAQLFPAGTDAAPDASYRSTLCISTCAMARTHALKFSGLFKLRPPRRV